MRRTSTWTVRLRGLERYEHAPVDRIRGATRRALENLVALCLDEAVDVLLIAGDLYDGDWRDYSTGLFLSAQMSALREGGVAVYWVRGNHDAASQLSRYLQMPDNVRELSMREPETVEDGRLGLAVHGQGFATRDVSDDLARRYPDARPGLFNVGLLHTALSGREGHAHYAPTSVDVLRNKGYDYWALGHVHGREVVCDSPWIVFPGNLQGRHAAETGPKGATVVSVEGTRVVSVEPRALDAVRWTVLRIDARAAASGDDVMDLGRAALEKAVGEAEGRLVAARVVVFGASRAHDSLVGDRERWENQLRAAANDVGGDGAWIERVRFETDAELDIDALATRDDAVGQLVQSLRSLPEDEARLSGLLESLAELRRRLPPELRRGAESLAIEEPAGLLEPLADVERTLLPMLIAHGAGEAE